MMFLVVGLGNPGSEYAQTRHNVGWEVIDAIAASLGWCGRVGDFERLSKTRFDALSMDGLAGSEKVLLLKPLTFMNLSGKSVQAAMAFYQLAPEQVMVVLDDLAMPCGKLRIRAGGSSGGHNGLKDIEKMLGTQNYPRLRLGIDAPPPRIPGRDYVLGRFTPEQRKALEPAVDRAGEAVLMWLQKGIERAMNAFNGEPEASNNG